MAFTKIVSPGIDTTGSYTVRDLNAVGVVTASAFSGPLTGNATGLTGTPDITVGAITAASADFSGNVSIGGTLTYEDVTNIDSIGIVTARDGIHVTGGSVGINTTVPAEKLDVVGTIRASAGTNQYMHMYPVAGAGYFDVRNATSYPSIVFRQIGSGGTEERLRITSSGNVGIGTNNPGTKLDILNGADANVIATVNGVDTSSEYLGLGINSGKAIITAGGNGSTSNALVFTTSNSGTESERVYITSGGSILQLGNGSASNPAITLSGTAPSDTLVTTSAAKIGMGTDNPGEKLHLTTTSGNCKLRIDAASAASVDFYNSGTRFSDMFTDASTGNFTITNRQNADIIFRTNGTNERLRITSDGKVGINRTPTQHPFEIQHASEPTVSLWRGSTKGAALQAQSGGTYLYSYENAPLVFSVNSASGFTERLRIKSSGTLESYSPDDTTPNIRWRSDDTNWFGALNQSVHGGTITSFLSCGGDWSANGTTYSATKALAAYPTSAIAVHNQYNNSWGSQFVFLTKAGGSTTTDGAVTERLRIDSSGRILKGMASSILGSSDVQLTGSGGPAKIAGYKSDNNPTANTSMLTVSGYSQSGSTFTGIGEIDFRVNQGSNTASGYHPGSIVTRVNGGSTTGTHAGHTYSYAGLKDRERITLKSKRYYSLPEWVSGSDTYNTFREEWDYQHIPGYNQYSWYRFTSHSSSSSRGGSVDIRVTWSSRHAGGNGYGHWAFHWRDSHANGYMEIGNVYKYHSSYLGGSYYGWASNPNLHVYEINDSGNNAGFYLRVQGHISANSNTYDGGVIQQFTISAHTNRLGADVNKFEFVGNSTPSDVGSQQGNVNLP